MRADGMPPRGARQGGPWPAGPDLSWETRAWRDGARRVCGLDEVGRGAIAGPVVAAAVILPQDAGVARRLAGVDDSKRLTPERRRELAPVIEHQALAWAVGKVDAWEIDSLGIARANDLAMLRAMAGLACLPDRLLVDGYRLKLSPLPQDAIVRGDGLVLSIAAASILAKVWRDRHLEGLDEAYPGYGLGDHKGYGTAAHRAAVARYGPSVVHRLSWRLPERCAP